MTNEFILGKIFINQDFPQESVLTANELVDRMRKRGVGIALEDLESWEKEGYLHPILRLSPIRKEEPDEDDSPYWPYSTEHRDLREYDRQEKLEYPTPESHLPWSEYIDESGESKKITLYHPFQELQVFELHTRFSVYFRRSTLISEEGFKLWKNRLVSEQRLAESASLKLMNRDLRLQGLLMVLGDCYLPRIRHRFRCSRIESHKPEYLSWLDWCKSLDVPETCLRFGFEKEQLSAEYIRLSRIATDIDPLRYWYVLIRHARRDMLGKLKNRALLAQELYDMAYILKFALHDIGAEDLRHPDDVVDGRKGLWKLKRYHKEVDYRDTRVLANILSEYGLNPMPIANLLCEGETEAVSIPMIADAMGIRLDSRRIRLECLNGSSIDVTKWGKILMRIRDENGVAFIVVDKENDSELRIKDLARQGLVELENCMLWQDEFEGDNWSHREIIEALNTISESEGIEHEFTIDELQKYLDEGLKISQCAQEMAWELAALRISKPEFGRKLADITCKRISSQIEHRTYEPKSPIEMMLARIQEIVTLRWTRTYPIIDSDWE